MLVLRIKETMHTDPGRNKIPSRVESFSILPPDA